MYFKHDLVLYKCSDMVGFHHHNYTCPFNEKKIMF